MPTFENSIKTKTRAALDKDAFQPGMGKLGAGSATEEALIHGTRVNKVESTFTSTVVSTSTITFQGPLTVMCASSVDTNVQGPTTQLHQAPIVHTATAPVIHNRYSTFMQNHMGPTIDNYISPWVRNVLGADVKQDYTPGIEIVMGPKLRMETMKLTIGASKIDVYAALTVAAAGIKLDYNMSRGGVDNIYAKIRGVKAEAGGVEAKAKAAQPTVAAARVNVGGVHAKIESRVKTLPGIGPPMPLVATS